MTQHTNFDVRLDDLQQRVATARSAVQTAASESRRSSRSGSIGLRPTWTSQSRTHGRRSRRPPTALGRSGRS